MICLVFNGGLFLVAEDADEFFDASRCWILFSLLIFAFLNFNSRLSPTDMAASTCLTRLESRKMSHSSAGLA